MFRVFQQFVDYVTKWPAPDIYQVLGLILAALQVVFAAIAVRTSGRRGAAHHEEAIREFAEVVRRRLDAEEYGLLTPAKINALAATIREKHRAPKLSNYGIAASLRRTALELETDFDNRRDKQLLKKLKTLSKLARHYDKEQPSYASINSVDSVKAYELSLMIISSALFALALISTRRYSAWVTWALALCQVPVIVSAIRAARYWRKPAADNVYSPARVGYIWRIIDMPLHFTLHESHFAHTVWAPIWEELGFHLLPLLILPSVIGVLVVMSARLIGASDDQLRLALIAAAVLVAILYFYVGMVLFTRLHRYKIATIRRLRKQLGILEAQRKVANGRTLGSADARVPICNQLWVLTGDPIYRQILGPDYALSGWEVEDE